MRCWGESFRRLTAALTCMSAKCGRNWGIQARRTTLRLFVAQGTSLRWRAQRAKTEPDEEPLSQDLSFVLDRASPVSGAGDSGYGRHAADAGNLCRGSVATPRPRRSG